MLRTATRSPSRTITKRTVKATHVSFSSTSVRFSNVNGIIPSTGSSRGSPVKTASLPWAIGVRLYTASAPKDVKQLVKDSSQVPPLPSSTARTGPSTSPATNGKKILEPKLTPRRVANSSNSSKVTTPQSATGHPNRASIRAADHAYEAPLSRPVLHSSSSSETISSSLTKRQHPATTAPFLVKPEPPETPGILKTAFNDIDDALTNGTLAPLPPALLKAQEAQRRKKFSTPGTTAANGVAKEGSPATMGEVEFTADTARIWWHKLKEMTKFYFFGMLKLGREHRVLAMQLSKRLREADNGRGVQSWRDREFVKTYKMDLLRLVPFLTIVAVLEETLPLIVLYAPFLLPSTCKLPAQAKRIDELADIKRWDSLLALGRILALREHLGAGRAANFDAVTMGDVAPVLGHESGVQEGRLDRLPEGSLPLLCKLLNIAPYGPSPYLKFRLRSTLAALSLEDTYFAHSSSTVDPISQLSLSELRTVLGRRGFPTTPLTLPQLRENLTWWLAHPEHPTERRLAAVLELARWGHKEHAEPGVRTGP